MSDNYDLPAHAKTAADWRAIGAMRVRARTDPEARRAVAAFDRAQTKIRDAARAAREKEREENGHFARGRNAYDDQHPRTEHTR